MMQLIGRRVIRIGRKFVGVDKRPQYRNSLGCRNQKRLDFSSLFCVLNGKTTYTGRFLTATDSLAWLESGVYKIFDDLPIGYPNGIDNYRYGLLIVTKVDDYVAYQLFAVDGNVSGLKHKVGFCHTTNREVILWI